MFINDIFFFHEPPLVKAPHLPTLHKVADPSRTVANQYLVRVHYSLSLSRTFLRLVHSLQHQLELGVLSRADGLAIILAPRGCLRGRNILRPPDYERTAACMDIQTAAFHWRQMEDSTSKILNWARIAPTSPCQSQTSRFPQLRLSFHLRLGHRCQHSDLGFRDQPKVVWLQ